LGATIIKEGKWDEKKQRRGCKGNEFHFPYFAWIEVKMREEK
jgi:hypothetical protein